MRPTIVLVLFLLLDSFIIGNKEPNQSMMHFVESISLTADAQTSPGSYTCKYYFDGEDELIYWRNKDGESIDVFDLNSQSLCHTIEFPMDGSLGFQSLKGGFSVLGRDTLLLSPNIPGKLYLFNNHIDNIKLLEYRSDNGHPMNEYAHINSRVNKDAFYFKDDIIIPLRTPGFFSVPSKQVVADINLFMAIDPLKSQYQPVSSIKIDYSLMNHDEPLAQSTTLTYGDKLYYQFGSNHHLYATEDLVDVQKKEILPSQTGNFISIYGKGDLYGLSAQNTQYFGLFHDKTNGLIYRLLKLPSKDWQNADKDHERDFIFERVLVVIVDEELNYVGEHLFENSFYSWNECFVGKKGLHILRSPYHEKYDYCNLTFDVWGVDS